MLTRLRTRISFLREALRHEKERRVLGEIRMRSGLGDGAWILHGLIRAERPDVVVEIGSATGWSACVMGCALKANNQGHLYAIDPHMPTQWNDGTLSDTFPVISRNVQRLGLESTVTVVRNVSGEVAKDWDQKIDLIFIDGDHSYDGVKNDWNLFLPHLQPFSFAIFHDTMWEVGKVNEEYKREDMGVPRFVDELRRQGYPVVTAPGNCGISIVQPCLNGMSLVKK